MTATRYEHEMNLGLTYQGDRSSGADSAHRWSTDLDGLLFAEEAEEQPHHQEASPAAPPPRCTAARFQALREAQTDEHQRFLNTGWEPGCGRHGHHQVELAVVSGLLARGATEEEISFFMCHPEFGAGELTRRHGLEHLGRTIAYSRRAERHVDVRVVGLYNSHQGLRATFTLDGGLVCTTVFPDNEHLLEQATDYPIGSRYVPSERGTSLRVDLPARVQIVGERGTRYAADGQSGTTHLPEVVVRWWPRTAPPDAAGPLAVYPEWYGPYRHALDQLTARGLRVDAELLACEWETMRADRRETRWAGMPDGSPDDPDAGLNLWVERVLKALDDGVAHPVLRERNAGRLFAWAGKACLTSWPKRLRGAWVARPGRRLVEADYSGLHVRIAAARAHDGVALAQQSAGDPYEIPTRDLLAFTHLPHIASQMARPLTDEEARKVAKTMTNAYLNGAGAAELAKQVFEATGVAPKGQDVLDAFRAYWPEIARWLQDTGTANTSFASRLGRAVTFKPEQLQNAIKLKRSSVVSAVMTSIEADAIRIALVELEALPGADVVLPLHDGLILEVDTDVQGIEERIAKVMEAALLEVCPGIEAVAKVGQVKTR